MVTFKIMIEKKSRRECSLLELTKNFIKFITEEKRDVIDLNKTTMELQSKKRRIYDITNVLEGIGYIKKTGKNEIKLNTDVKLFADSISKQNSEEEKSSDKNDESEYKNSIKILYESLKKLVTTWDYINFAYVSANDLRELNTSEKSIVVKAPFGTTIEIPDSDEAAEILRKTDKESSNFGHSKKAVKSKEKNNLKKYIMCMTSKTNEIMWHAIENPKSKNIIKSLNPKMSKD